MFIHYVYTHYSELYITNICNAIANRFWYRYGPYILYIYIIYIYIIYIYIIFLFRDTIIESNAFGDPYSVIVLGCTLPKLLKTHQDVWPSKLVAVPFCTNKSIPFNLEGV